MAYVAVLMTAMLVTIAALSGLSTARSRLRSVDTASHTTRARFYAESAVEMGLHTLGADSNWRTTYRSGEWISERDIGTGGYAWKLVDEVDNDLGAGLDDPVRLYGKGVVGDAMRIYSVELKPRAVPNILGNSGFEAGTRGWDTEGACELALSTGDPYRGEACGRVTNQFGIDAGIYYDITSQVTKGASYYVEARVGGLGISPNLDILVDATGSQQSVRLGSRFLATGWQKITGNTTVTWSGTLNRAYLKVSEPFPISTYYVDEVVMVEGDAAPDTPMVPVPGTWRREGS